MSNMMCLMFGSGKLVWRKFWRSFQKCLKHWNIDVRMSDVYPPHKIHSIMLFTQNMWFTVEFDIRKKHTHINVQTFQSSPKLFSQIYQVQTSDTSSSPCQCILQGHLDLEKPTQIISCYATQNITIESILSNSTMPTLPPPFFKKMK